MAIKDIFHVGKLDDKRLLILIDLEKVLTDDEIEETET